MCSSQTINPLTNHQLHPVKPSTPSIPPDMSGKMSELNRVAILKAHMIELKTRVFDLMNQMETNEIETTATIESLRAALGDAECEMKFVKTTAIKAIGKLATVMHEREQIADQVKVLEREKQQLLEINMYLSQETPGPQETPHESHADVCDVTWTVVERRESRT